MKDIGNTVGFKDMHPMQVSAVMSLISESIYLASMQGAEHVEEFTDIADEVVKLFGGNSVTTVIIDH